MNIVLDLLWRLAQFIYHLVVGIVRACLPARWIGFKDVRGQTVLITGAAMGMGRLLALRFAELGCRLVLWDINQTALEETSRELRAKGSTVTSYTVDLSRREDIYKVADKVKAEIGDVDILINNAGVVTGSALMDADDNSITRTMDVNVNAHFWTIKAFLPAMMTKNKGHIVSVASIAGHSSLPGLVDYCTSKFAARGLMETLDLELHTCGFNGVHTTTISPFIVNTGMFGGVKKNYHLLKMLEPEYAVDKMVEAVLTNQHTLFIPGYLFPIILLQSILPVQCQRHVCELLGLDKAMNTFVGHSKKQ